MKQNTFPMQISCQERKSKTALDALRSMENKIENEMEKSKL